MQLFVPLGEGRIGVAASVVASHVVATARRRRRAHRRVTTNIATKMGACVGLSSIAQVCASPIFPSPHTLPTPIPHPAGAPRRLWRVLLLSRRLDDAGQDHSAARPLDRAVHARIRSIDGAHEPRVVHPGAVGSVAPLQAAAASLGGDS